ncbi:S8 family peptidase [Pseudochelatococcus sp. B33]
MLAIFRQGRLPLATSLPLVVGLMVAGDMMHAAHSARALAQAYPLEMAPPDESPRRTRPRPPRGETGQWQERPRRPPSRVPPGYPPPVYYPPPGVIVVPVPPYGGPPPPGFYPVDPEPPRQRPRQPRRETQPARTPPPKAQPPKPQPSRPQPPRQATPVPPPPPAVLPPPRALLAAETEHVPDEILFVLRPDLPLTQEQAVADAFALTLVDTTPLALIGVSVVRARVGEGRSAPETVLALAGDPRVESAQLNHLFAAQQDGTADPEPAGKKPDEEQPEKAAPEKAAPQKAEAGEAESGEAAGAGSMASAQYAPAQLKVPQSHALATGEGVRIAVIDSGVETDHPEIAGRLLEGSVSRASSAHGTAVAGIIAARERLTGIAPGSRILAIDAFTDREGREIGSTLDILRGLERAAKHDARIANLSFAGPRDDLLARTLRALTLRGVVLVAAAGNGGADAAAPYPADHPDVLGVTAVDARGALYEKATHGPHVALAAPGVELLAPTVDKGYQMVSGTSMASAHIAGVAALVLQVNPDLTPEALRELLLATARDIGPAGPDPMYGAGEADAHAAVLEARKRRVETAGVAGEE